MPTQISDGAVKKGLKFNPPVVLNRSGRTCIGNGTKPGIVNAGVNTPPVVPVEGVVEDHPDMESRLFGDGDGLIK